MDGDSLLNALVVSCNQLGLGPSTLPDEERKARVGLLDLCIVRQKKFPACMGSDDENGCDPMRRTIHTWLPG